MSAPDSFSPRFETRGDRSEVATFARWPGLLRLSLGVLLGPVVALVNQELIYSVNMWACGRGMHWTMHIVPLLCLAATLGAALVAYRDWQSVGRGLEDEQATVETRSRFLSLLGIAISVFSSMVILAQWAAIFVFGPCMRA